MITIKEIAKEARVSIATVSRVLNGTGGYSQETFDRVNKIADAHHYLKNAAAHTLVSASSKIIGILIPSVSTSFSGDIINGIEDAAYAAGYDVILAHTGIGGDERRLLENINMMRNRQVEGLVIVSNQFTETALTLIQRLRLNTTLISTSTRNNSLPAFVIDDVAAMHAVTSYLLSIGHQHIAIIGADPDDHVTGAPRIKGYRDAMMDAGMVPSIAWVQRGDFSYESGYTGFKRLYSGEHDITAVCCVSDEAALGVIAAAHEFGLSVPDDLSVTGFDGTRLSEMVRPRLTTVRQPFYRMGKAGATALLQHITSGESINGETFPFEIEIRESTKPLDTQRRGE